jgi:hypothetical protein
MGDGVVDVGLDGDVLSPCQLEWRGGVLWGLDAGATELCLGLAVDA